MNVKELIEELKKLPPQVELQKVRLDVRRYGNDELTKVTWQGNHILLEAD